MIEGSKNNIHKSGYQDLAWLCAMPVLLTQAASCDSGGQGNWPDTSASRSTTFPLPTTEAPLDDVLSYTFDLPLFSSGMVLTLSHVAHEWVYNLGLTQSSKLQTQ